MIVLFVCLSLSLLFSVHKPKRHQYPSDDMNTAGRTGGAVRPPSPDDDDDALAEEALGILSPEEKDELILQMHDKLRRLVSQLH